MLCHRSRILLPFILAFTLSACGSLTEDADNAFTISGKAENLKSDSLVISNNEDEEITVPEEGSFSFSKQLSFGDDYKVEIVTQPTSPEQVCTIREGSGKVRNSDISNIRLFCVVSTFTIGGQVNVEHINNDSQTFEFGTPLIIKNNGADDLLINQSGKFVFHTGSAEIQYEDFSEYDISIFAQPSDPDLNCALRDGTGKGRVDGAKKKAEEKEQKKDITGNVTSIIIDCEDITPPEILRTVPPAAAIGISRNVEPRIYFSEVMDIDVATEPDPPILVPQVSISSIVSETVYTPSSTEFFTTTTPDSTLSAETQHTVTVDTDPETTLTDKAGNPLPEPAPELDYTWSFKTADGQWEEAESVEEQDTTAHSPQIAVDSSGNAIIVWAQQVDGDYKIFANYKASTDANWTPENAQEISTITEGNARNPKVAFNPSGVAMVVWTQDGGNYSSIWSNHYDSGWQGTARVDPASSAGDAASPQIVANSAGNFITAWSQAEANTYNIYSNYFTTAWQTNAVLVDSDTGNARTPRIAIHTNNDIYATWAQQTDGINFSILAARSTDDAVSWQNLGLVENDDGRASNPRIAVNSSGLVFVAWEQETNGLDSDTRVNLYQDSAWGTPVELDSPTSGDAYNVSLATDSNDDAFVVWEENIGAYSVIQGKKYLAAPDNSWQTTERIDSAVNLDASAPLIAMDGPDQGLVIWTQNNDEGRYKLMASRYNAADGWGTPEVISETNTADVFTPYIFPISDTSNKAAVVWAESTSTFTESTPYDIYYRLYKIPD